MRSSCYKGKQLLGAFSLADSTSPGARYGAWQQSSERSMGRGWRREKVVDSLHVEGAVWWEGEGEASKLALSQAGRNGSVIRLEPAQSTLHI